MTATRKSTKSRTATDVPSGKFTAEEMAAMKERAKELKVSTRRGSDADRTAGEEEVLAKIAEMPEPDRAMAERVHALVTTAAPELVPKTYYGMPAYAKDGKVICFFKPKSKFKVRYATFEFQPDASLDDGAMWPVVFALTKLTATEEARIRALVKQAVG